MRLFSSDDLPASGVATEPIDRSAVPTDALICTQEAAWVDDTALGGISCELSTPVLTFENWLNMPDFQSVQAPWAWFSPSGETTVPDALARDEIFSCGALAEPATLDEWLQMELSDPDTLATAQESRLGFFILLGFVVGAAVLLIVTIIVLRRSEKRFEEMLQAQVDEDLRLRQAAQERQAPQAQDPQAQEAHPIATVVFPPMPDARPDVSRELSVEVPEHVRCRMCSECLLEPTGTLELLIEDILLPAVWGDLLVHNGIYSQKTHRHLATDPKCTHLFLGCHGLENPMLFKMGEVTTRYQLVDGQEHLGEALVSYSETPIMRRKGHVLVSLARMVIDNEFWCSRERAGELELMRVVLNDAAQAIEPDGVLREHRRRALKAARDRQAVVDYVDLKRTRLRENRTRLQAQLSSLQLREVASLTAYLIASRELTVLEAQAAPLARAQVDLQARCDQALSTLRCLPIVAGVAVDECLEIDYVADEQGSRWFVKVPLLGDGRFVWTCVSGHNGQGATTRRFTAPGVALMNAMAQPLVDLDLAALATRLHNMIRAGILIPYNQETLP